jgi:predicted esterase
MDERRIEVRRTARYHVLGHAAEATEELWLVCHGYAQLARHFLRSFAAIATPARLIAAPEALNRYYFETSPGVHPPDARVAATWMTREDRVHEIGDYTAYLDALFESLLHEIGRAAAAPPRTIVLGFSQGAQTVSRWAAARGRGIDHLVLWGAGAAAEVEPGLLPASARLSVVAGDADPAFPPAVAQRFVARCRAAGRDARLLRHGGGHRIESEALERLAADIAAGRAD